jgi:HEAT repeat protein
MRQYAARVLGAIGVKNFYQPVLHLMNDSDLRVRREAVIAAGVLKSPEFVIPLIYRTQARETLREATQSLTMYGATILTTLAKVLSNQLEDANIRRAIARVLGKLGSSEAVEVIAQHLDEADEELRGVMYRALARAVKGKRLLLKDVSPVKRALTRELERAWRALHQLELLRLDAVPGTDTARAGEPAARALLASALIEKVKQVETRVFLLLAVLYADADMEQISAGIQDATAADASRRRGNAVELLDNLLDRDVKARFLPLVEEIPRSERLKQVVEQYPAPNLTPEAALLELTRDEAAWVRACATWCLSESATQPVPVRDDMLTQGVADVSPVVREIALVSLDRKSPLLAAALIEGRLKDEAPLVRRQAALLSARGRAQPRVE